MEIDFVDIKIVSLEDDMTVESPNNPALRYIYLKLSQTPPPLWQKHFADSRKVARHTKWRNIWIDRKFFVVECVPMKSKRIISTISKRTSPTRTPNIASI